MKRILIPGLMSGLLAVAAVPAFADAEDFGKKMLKGPSSSAATFKMGADVLEGDNVDDNLPYNDAEIVTRDASPTTAGHIQMARQMGVDPNSVTRAELAKMYIGAYD